jgi:hypothetical protein
MPIDDCKREIDLRFTLKKSCFQRRQLDSNNCFLVLYEQDKGEENGWRCVGKTVS